MVEYRLWALVTISNDVQALSRRPWGRKLLLKYPAFFSLGMFTHAGPTEQQMATTSFSMTFFARGYAQGTSQVLQITLVTGVWPYQSAIMHVPEPYMPHHNGA